MRGIKVLTFDTGGTILDWHGGITAVLAERGARRGVEIEIMAGDHQDLAGLHPEELCRPLIRLRQGLVDAQHLARDHCIPIDPVPARDIDHQ